MRRISLVTVIFAILAGLAALIGAGARAPDGDGAVTLPADLPRPLDETDFALVPALDDPKVALGRLLFFDKILSGNRNIACASCHHPLAATGDGRALPIGEGGRGLGVTRTLGDGANAAPGLVPRNSPPLFNLGAGEIGIMFHDGRIERDPAAASGFRNPAGADLPSGLESVVAAQAMFPVTSADEMAGHDGENPIADAAAAGRLAGPGGVWTRLADRIRAIPDYADRFARVFTDIDDADDITFVHAANAIAAFEKAAFQADGSPFDRWLRGDAFALDAAAERGLFLFYGEAGCSACHAGPLMTDQAFHAIAIPQRGPGKGDGVDGRDDFGRERVSGEQADRFRFRTPALRNVALTGPWGHSGAYERLEDVVRHHLDPQMGLTAYYANPAPDALTADRHRPIAEACELKPLGLDDAAVDDLVAFLHALTDPRSLDLRWAVPATVPSGLPVYD